MPSHEHRDNVRFERKSKFPTPLFGSDAIDLQWDSRDNLQDVQNNNRKKEYNYKLVMRSIEQQKLLDSAEK